MPYKPKSNDLTELLYLRGLEQPYNVAYTYLKDGEKEEINLTYGELDHKAKIVSQTLREMGGSGKCILLLYPPGLDFIVAFFGCLYAKAIAIPVYQPRLSRQLSRLQAVVADTEATIAISTESTLSRIRPIINNYECLRRLSWVATDTLPGDLSVDLPCPGIGPDTIALLQYTSGSISSPKGVVVTHGNLLNNEATIQQAFRQNERSLIVGWLPLYHDMGLIGNVLQPLYSNSRCILMSPAAFLQRPLRWLQAISSYRATTSGGPNFAYDLCVRKINPEEVASLDLENWSVAFNGSEPINANTLEQFATKFESCGFRREAFSPCYGLAESTLFVAGKVKGNKLIIKTVRMSELAKNLIVETSANDKDIKLLVSCGNTSPDHRIVIVDPETLTECGPKTVGEIWISGPSVAQGYWNRPDETENSFRAYLADTGEGPFLRTGDLGFVQDGELFLTGRYKDIIIIRGLNHYPQDIELSVANCDKAIRPDCSAAFSIDLNGEECLIVVQEIDSHQLVVIEELGKNIQQAISEKHDIQAHAIAFIKSNTIPRTSSGKIRRQSCRNRFIEGKLDILAKWERQSPPYEATALPVPASASSIETCEAWLVSYNANNFGINPGHMDVSQPLTRYGLDSLSALGLMQAIETEFGVTLPMVSFLQEVSIRELAIELYEKARGNDYCDSIPVVPSSQNIKAFPLSHGQQSIWYLSNLASESAAYNISSAFRIKLKLDVLSFKRAIQTLVGRHISLRATFYMRQGALTQIIREDGDIDFEIIDASTWDENELSKALIDAARCPFDLKRGPLLRVSLFRDFNQHYTGLLVINHIVSDLWSLVILIHELATIYSAEQSGSVANLGPLEFNYSDYVHWQSKMLESPEGERLGAFWKRQLSGKLPVLNLPIDRPRPPIQTYRGDSHLLKMSGELTDELNYFSCARGTTLYTTLLAAFQILLQRYTRQNELLIGSPTAGRDRAEFREIIGYFVNPIVIRGTLDGNPTFENFLSQMRQVVLDAFKHQNYPFGLLVEQLELEPDRSRSPLFQVAFVMQKAVLPELQSIASFAIGEPGATLEYQGLVLESIALKQRPAQFELTLAAAETRGRLAIALQYNTDLFDEATIHRFGENYRALLGAIIADPSQTIKTIPLLNAAEYRQILAEWNSTQIDYSLNRCLHELFEKRAERIPDGIAVVCEGELMSYRELNGRANQLARYLQKLGIGAESLVGICFERSTDMIIALLGALKAGGGYVPLDPDYPETRLSLMIKDAGLNIVLTQQSAANKLLDMGPLTVCIDSIWPSIAQLDAANLGRTSLPENLTYVLFTSGSTGKSKGAIITHHAICNRLLWMQDAFELSETDRVLQKTPLSFDVSVWEVFWPLLFGGRLILAKPGGHRDSAYLSDLITTWGITIVHFVPSMLRAMLEQSSLKDCVSLSDVICSGEELPYNLQERFFAHSKAALHNLYGPTEAAIDVTSWVCEKNGKENSVPIGHPIANTRIYILDEYLQAVPIGVAGEIHISGYGLARGYCGGPDLTAEKFIPDSFSESAGERMYKTGDLGSYRSNGRIEYLGRIDHQVKIRGNRIEIREVEGALAQHTDVNQAFVVASENALRDKELIAYVSLNPERKLSVRNLRDHLKKILPEYMLPTTYVQVDEMPLTSNGKLDRTALLRANQQKVDLGNEFALPRNPLEDLLARMWAKSLGVEEVGIYDDFFALGGHSILASKLISQLQYILPVKLPLLTLFFQSPTIADFAEAIIQNLGDSLDANRLMQALNQLSHLTEEEMEFLLRQSNNDAMVAMLE